MIKFRAWDKEFKIMSEVTRIDYRADIFDKDSKEIFEGDILGMC